MLLSLIINIKCTGIKKSCIICFFERFTPEIKHFLIIQSEWSENKAIQITSLMEIIHRFNKETKN